MNLEERSACGPFRRCMVLDLRKGPTVAKALAFGRHVRAEHDKRFAQQHRRQASQAVLTIYFSPATEAVLLREMQSTVQFAGTRKATGMSLAPGVTLQASTLVQDGFLVYPETYTPGR